MTRTHTSLPVSQLMETDLNELKETSWARTSATEGVISFGLVEVDAKTWTGHLPLMEKSGLVGC